MKAKHLISVVLLSLAHVATAGALGTAFTYQGRLQSGAGPATGLFDFSFTLYDAATNGTQIGPGSVVTWAVPVTNGVFTVTLDFGSVFGGQATWLSIGVKTNGAQNFTGLSPRQSLTPSPYSVYATGSGTAAALAGTLPVAQLPSAAVTNNASTVTLTGTFSGNGAGLTNLNASDVGVGTLADARLSSNVALLNANQTFAGQNKFTGVLTLSNSTQVYGNVTMNSQEVYLKNDNKHGLGYYGISRPFGTNTPDGPVLYGYSGGMLGYVTFTATNPVLTWTSSGRVGIGTNNPQSALQVVGSVTAHAINAPPVGVIPVIGMVWIQSGTFLMGSRSDEPDRGTDEGPQTFVTLTRGFWVGSHEVTQGEYQAIVGSNPSHFTGDLNRPVEMVTWYNATNYCSLLTQAERTAGRLPSNWFYRLPTEAEWEYCCRAGARTTRRSYGDDLSSSALTNYAWYAANASSTTHAVEQKLGNPWGLADMYGNVWEWCQDRYGTYPGGSVTDPQGPGTGSDCVLRGGAYSRDQRFCRSAARYYWTPDGAFDTLGFRVVLAPQ